MTVTSMDKKGRALCYKTFLTENPGFLPGFRIFPDFYWTKLPGMISGFRKTKLYKNPLRIVGEDSKHTNTTYTIYYYGDGLSLKNGQTKA